MLTINETETQALTRLGEQLRQRRLARNDRQSDAAARLGISPGTYRKMEAGHPSIPIGYWIRAIDLYDNLSALDGLLADRRDLFERLAAEKQAAATPPRQRARRR